MQAMRQVAFTDVLIVGRLDVDGQSFAPIGVHKIDPWLVTQKTALQWYGRLARSSDTVEEQIDETDIRKIPQIVWAESGSLTVPV